MLQEKTNIELFLYLLSIIMLRDIDSVYCFKILVIILYILTINANGDVNLSDCFRELQYKYTMRKEFNRNLILKN
jgi:hypothetical protein